MFGASKRSGAAAVIDIGNGSAGIAVITAGENATALAYAREEVTPESRSADALGKATLRSLEAAGEKVLKELSATKHPKISHCYCIIGAPWTRSTPGEATSTSEQPLVVTAAMISELGKRTLETAQGIEKGNLIEANVVHVVLNGYSTETPVGKRARQIGVSSLLSDCDKDVKLALQESIAKLFPDVPVTWRSSARAAIVATRPAQRHDALIVVVGLDATDAMVVRKSVLTQRELIPQGMQQIATSFAAGKPVEETMTLLDMLEKEQCDTDGCKALEESIAKTEPELAHSFGEIFAKLSASRKLPEDLILIAPPQFASWAARFFSRIDFTQFTTTARPFTVSPLAPESLQGVPTNDPRMNADPGLSVACSLVNTELHE